MANVSAMANLESGYSVKGNSVVGRMDVVSNTVVADLYLDSTAKRRKFLEMDRVGMDSAENWVAAPTRERRRGRRPTGCPLSGFPLAR